MGIILGLLNQSKNGQVKTNEEMLREINFQPQNPQKVSFIIILLEAILRKSSNAIYIEILRVLMRAFKNTTICRLRIFCIQILTAVVK